MTCRRPRSWLRELFELFELVFFPEFPPMPPPAPGAKALIDTMVGDDATVAADQTKLTADQADDAAAHAGLVSYLAANGGVIGALAADGLSLTVYRLNSDGTTIEVENIPIAA